MHIRDHLLASAAVKEQTADTCAEATEKAAMAIASSLRSGGKLMLCGNGGSAGDAQYILMLFVCRSLMTCSDFVSIVVVYNAEPGALFARLPVRFQNSRICRQEIPSYCNQVHDKTCAVA